MMGAEMNTARRVSVLGSKISICNTESALQLLEQRLQEGHGGYVCFTSAHGAVMGRRDARFRSITNNSFLSVADGKPIYWTGRLKGAPLGHTPGPDFMPKALARFAHRRHFFYGSTPPVLAALVERMQRQIPGLNVCGTLSPPFRALTAQETEAIREQIKSSGAEFVWIGLGAPKQELWMADAWQPLRPAILMGVGAAFDFHAGTLKRAPLPLRRVGLEWLYRLSQEPGRLWKRYLHTNSLFLYYSLREAVVRDSSEVA
jgi:N-acetylglucosaminyldiphosphoundecaprenol N-acetyl-beta-D-mannosaminyltransferase